MCDNACIYGRNNLKNGIALSWTVEKYIALQDASITILRFWKELD